MNSHLHHPTVELSTPMEEILDVDTVIVTHTHADHWDEAAMERVPKHFPLCVQHEHDRAVIRERGFQDVGLLTESTAFEGVILHCAAGQHGSDVIMRDYGDVLGQVMGVVLDAPQEKKLYLAGDMIWNSYVESTLACHRPEVVVLNAGDAQIPEYGSIIMGIADVRRVCEAAPEAVVIASHMEAVNHATLTRDALQKAAQEQGFATNLRIPADDESYVL